ncbi:hypothetical protein Lser_V15G00773 [Lactuca serriola]
MSIDEYTSAFTDKMEFPLRIVPDELTKINKYTKGLPWAYVVPIRQSPTFKTAIWDAKSMEEMIKNRAANKFEVGRKRKKTGHYASECTTKIEDCFKYGEEGHFKQDFPKREGATKPNVPPKGTFLVNGLFAHVLFDLGATRSFVSLILRKKFPDTPETLDSPLEVEIVDDRTMCASRVFHGCVLNMFSERFSIDLVSISLTGSKVIIGMDWLGPNGDVIDCEQQLVRIQTPSEGELVNTSERASHGPALYSTMWARRYLQHGCFRFLAYVFDMWVEATMKLSRVPIVRDFPNVFYKDLPRVPPKRQVEFQIDLVLGVTPVAKATYHLTPQEMEELSVQL